MIQTIREKFGHSIIVMIGDGITDMEACPPADAFIGNFRKGILLFFISMKSLHVLDLLIGFGGNVEREVVKTNAGWFVTDFQDLINVLQDVK